MASSKSFVSTAISSTLVFSFFLFGAIAPCRAQASVVSSDDEHPFDTNALKPWVTPASVVTDSVSTDQPTSGDPADAPPPQAAKTVPDDGWHLAVSPYLWFPGVHGTVVGPNGNGLGFSASPGDLLSHFRFGIMGAVEARHKRIVTSLDMMWIRLGADNAIPFPPLNAASANIHATEFLLTPKIGFRLINEKMIKVDALAGIRYWHLGETLNFNPSLLGLNFNGSTNFVDPVVGGRIQVFLTPKIGVTILGDVGGWDTGSQLEYQVGGLIGYRIKPALSLEVGYRYLYVDYRNGRGAVFDVTTEGVLFGVTINLK